MSKEKTLEKANQCLKDRVDIPGAPVWHLGMISQFDSAESFELMQNTIDYLTCKAKQDKMFTDDEKEFMKELFEAFWWGGMYRRYFAAAKLANHYVHGEGATIIIDSSVYRNSAIVKDTMIAMKNFIRDRYQKNDRITGLRTTDIAFRNSSYSYHLKRGRRNQQTLGCIWPDGALMAEQLNIALRKADHRFHLHVRTKFDNRGNFYSRWQVESIYDFEPFSKGNITDLPLSPKFSLKLPDGLSHYLTTIGVAKEFTHISEWSENWK